MASITKIRRNSDGAVFETVLAAVDAFKCPGPCNPDCPLNKSVQLPNGQYGHKCHPDYIAGHPTEIMRLIGCTPMPQEEEIIRNLMAKHKMQPNNQNPVAPSDKPNGYVTNIYSQGYLAACLDILAAYGYDTTDLTSPETTMQQHRLICIQRTGYATVPANTDTDAIIMAKTLKESDFEWEQINEGLIDATISIVETYGPDGEVLKT